MNVDAILETLNRHDTDYILIGGVNFMLNHAPILTFDVDIWIKDDSENSARLNSALIEMSAEWGATEANWKRVESNPAWLLKQNVFCLTSMLGAIDIFREVKGLEGKYSQCKARAQLKTTGSGISYVSLADEDMLRCQEALEPTQQHVQRITLLRAAIERRGRRP